MVTVSRGSLRTGDTNRSFPEESPWPGSLPSVRTVLPNPVSPERELLHLYRWMDIGHNEASSIKCHQAQTGFSFGCYSAQFSGLKTEYNQWKQPVHWKRGVFSEDTGKVQSDQTKHFCHFTLQQNALWHLTVGISSEILFWIHKLIHNVTCHTTSLKKNLPGKLALKISFCPPEPQTQDHDQELKQNFISSHRTGTFSAIHSLQHPLVVAIIWRGPLPAHAIRGKVPVPLLLRAHCHWLSIHRKNI